jgi:hypothetical protein
MDNDDNTNPKPASSTTDHEVTVPIFNAIDSVNIACEEPKTINTNPVVNTVDSVNIAREPGTELAKTIDIPIDPALLALEQAHDKTNDMVAVVDPL